uniref:Uncharacterized protein n=1 Tax=Timema genevievae TaxID=629358 RepID=A0A7R9JQ65_TIMGE|nr:unnamed protein product [Timema genevievae]
MKHIVIYCFISSVAKPSERGHVCKHMERTFWNKTPASLVFHDQKDIHDCGDRGGELDLRLEKILGKCGGPGSSASMNKSSTLPLPHRANLERPSSSSARDREGYYSDRNELIRDRERERERERDRGYLSDHNSRCASCLGESARAQWFRHSDGWRSGSSNFGSGSGSGLVPSGSTSGQGTHKRSPWDSLPSLRHEGSLGDSGYKSNRADSFEMRAAILQSDVIPVVLELSTRVQLANALVVLSQTTEDVEIEVRISVGEVKHGMACLRIPSERWYKCRACSSDRRVGHHKARRHSSGGIGNYSTALRQTTARPIERVQLESLKKMTLTWIEAPKLPERSRVLWPSREQESTVPGPSREQELSVLGPSRKPERIVQGSFKGLHASKRLPYQDLQENQSLPSKGLQEYKSLPSQGLQESKSLPSKGRQESKSLPSQDLQEIKSLPSKGRQESKSLPSRQR